MGVRELGGSGGSGQGVFQAGDYPLAYCFDFTEAYFAFGRVDVEVDLSGGDFQEEEGYGEESSGSQGS